MSAFRKFMCRFLWCTSCKLHSTDEGIGGKCIHCGKLWGWVTRNELREYANRAVALKDTKP